MKHVRTLAVTAAVAAVSFGLIGLSAPAHASDISWGYAVHKKL